MIILNLILLSKFQVQVLNTTNLDNTFNLYDSLSLCVLFLMLSNRLFDRSVQRGKRILGDL
jgi:ABC-type uncharacterized transport system permease subunit